MLIFVFLTIQIMSCGKEDFSGTIKQSHDACQNSGGVEYYPEDNQCFCENGVICESGRICDSITHACKECNSGDTRACKSGEDICVWGEWQNKDCYNDITKDNDDHFLSDGTVEEGSAYSPVTNSYILPECEGNESQCVDDTLRWCYKGDWQETKCANGCKDVGEHEHKCNEINSINDIKCNEAAINNTICFNANQYICARNGKDFKWSTPNGFACGNLGCNTSMRACGCDPNSFMPQFENGKVRYCAKEHNSLVIKRCIQYTSESTQCDQIQKSICSANYLITSDSLGLIDSWEICDYGCNEETAQCNQSQEVPDDHNDG